MTGQVAARIQLAIAGALGGALLWLIVRAGESQRIPEYPAFALFGLVVVAFGSCLAMAGPIGLPKAAVRGFGLGALVGGLIWMTALRYAGPDAFLNTPMPGLAVPTVATLPVPFLIAAAKTSWRDYPSVFLEAWSIVLRTAAAGLFSGLLWLVVFLSDQVLGIVGIDLVGRLLAHDVVPVVLGGAIFGLGMAVIHDLAELLSPYVMLRVFRLLLPIVLAVMAIFLMALPFRGLDGLVSGLSPAALLLTMVAGGIALVSIAVDQSDADATQSPLLVRCAQLLAVLLPLVASLALYAIWVRVRDYGLTPERIFIVIVALIGVVYGLVYASAVLRGGAWMERIRQGNIRIALGIILCATLWLTPVLNAERMSAQSQLARFTAGRTPVEALDVAALRSWGKPGEDVLAVLAAQAKEPGQEALAQVLAGEAPAAGPDPSALVAKLVDAMPVQPATATGTRDGLLAALDGYVLEDWLRVCQTALPDGRPGCVMVVADLLPARPGEEAMLFLQRSLDYTDIQGIYLDDEGRAVLRPVMQPDGRYVDAEAAAALLRTYQDVPPPVTPALVNQLGTDGAGLLFLP